MLLGVPTPHRHEQPSSRISPFQRLPSFAHTGAPQLGAPRSRAHVLDAAPPGDKSPRVAQQVPRPMHCKSDRMDSHAKFLGHPIHQMLVPLPIGAFAFSVVMDVVHSRTGRREHARAAVGALDFGLLSATLAVPFGLVDWLAIATPSRAKRVGKLHAWGNVAMLGIFATSRIWRTRGEPTHYAKWLSGSAFLLSGVTAWLGGELVDRHGIGVREPPARNSP